MNDLILLHGAMGSSDSLEDLKQVLSTSFNCHSFNFSGHGNTTFNSDGFGIEYFAEELDNFIVSKKLKKPCIFGYSMGGYVALHLASQGPNKIDKIITLGTKFGWSPESAEKETSRMNPDVMEEKIPAYTQKLAETHGQQWKELVWQTAGMMLELGEEPLLSIETMSRIQNPVLIMRGTEDQMVGDVESKWAVAHLANGQFLKLENQPHPIEKVDIMTLSDIMRDYL